jgi:hypothetical protein
VSGRGVIRGPLHRGEPGRGPGLAADGGRLPPPHAHSNALVRAKVQLLLTRWPQALGTSGFAHQAPALFSHPGVEARFPLFLFPPGAGSFWASSNKSRSPIDWKNFL